ncbi:unnamed protein product [Linum tenue]|uniref:Uncharacterized protein n=1 Tax=Linum tenue TaxID=586396 RepID=A0AAV0L3U4_9ROSI|nr:unnamed protein product [Linum tenue]
MCILSRHPIAKVQRLSQDPCHYLWWIAIHQVRKMKEKTLTRLREERLIRIARYKTRLALLLPPQAEQFRNDTAAGN